MKLLVCFAVYVDEEATPHLEALDERMQTNHIFNLFIKARVKRSGVLWACVYQIHMPPWWQYGLLFMAGGLVLKGFAPGWVSWPLIASGAALTASGFLWLETTYYLLLKRMLRKKGYSGQIHKRPIEEAILYAFD